MEQASPPSSLSGLVASLKASSSFAAKVIAGAVLIFAAGLVAMLTAFAGLMLAGTALLLRYVAVRRPQPIPARVKDQPITLQARRTPRGWTVE
jgi:hypothetical protein